MIPPGLIADSPDDTLGIMLTQTTKVGDVSKHVTLGG